MILAILALLIPIAPAACDIRIEVFEARRSAMTSHCLNVAARSVSQAQVHSSDSELPPITEYDIEKDQLQRGETRITDAVEILAQARVDGLDVVVIRNEYNSFSNPLRILAAVAGHPAQVSEVIVLVLRDHRVVGRWRLERATSSYEWRAVLRKAV